VSKELVNKVARVIASSIWGWTADYMDELDFTTTCGIRGQAAASAAVAAIQAMTPQDRPGSANRALRASAAFFKLHSMQAPPCFVPKDEVVAMAVRARQGDKTALAQLLALVEWAEGASSKEDRTPKTIAVAMLHAYEAAALDAVTAWYEAPKDTPDERKLYERMMHCGKLCNVVRKEAGAARAGWTDLDFGGSQPLLSDYMARLTGQRDRNAPPAET